MKTLLKAFLTLLVVSSAVNATEIRLVVNDGVDEGFNDNGAPMPNQTGNTGTTLGEQRLNVFQAAADYWEERLRSDVPVRVGIQFNDLFCSPFSATLGSAGPRGIFRDFPNAPIANTWFVGAVADSLAGSDRQPTRPDIEATFNSGIDNNDGCLRGTNWWLGIDSPAPRGTISLFDTVLHEIGHGLGVVSLVSQTGRLNGGRNDAYSYYLFDETTNTFWRDMTDNQRATSAINTGNLVWRGPNADANSGHITAGKTNGHLRMFAPNPYQGGSSVSHWDTALSPDELMEPSATTTSDDRSTVQLLKDVGWRIVEGPGSVSFEPAAVSVVEGSGPAVLRLRRTGTGGAVSVLVNSSGITATDGVDYDSINNQVVSWADEESGIKTVSVSVVDDGVADNGETALFTISGATGGVQIGAQDTTTLTINDPVPGEVAFNSATYSVVEDAGPAILQLERIGGTDGAVSVLVNSSGITATDGVDYNSISNQLVSWNDGEAGIKTVVVTVIDDSVVEAGGETAEFTLSGAAGGVSIGSQDTTTLTIDDPDRGTVGFTAASFSVIENAGPAILQLERVGGTGGDVSVQVSSSNLSATGGVDYNSISNQAVSWVDGESGIKTVEITVIDDGLTEVGGETVLFTISNSAGGVVIGAQSTTTLTINDPAVVPVPGSVSFRAAAYSVVEDAGPAMLELERTGGTDGAVSVRVNSANGTAVGGGVDFESVVNQQVSWADGESGIRRVTVVVIDDSVAEAAGGETATFAISGAIGGVAIGAQSTTTLTINDPAVVPVPGSVSFRAAALNITEGQGPAELQVQRTGGTTGAVAVTINSSDVSATGGGVDYVSIVNQTLNWADGESDSRTVSVTIVDDTLVEPSGETALFRLSDATNGAILARESLTLTILDAVITPPSEPEDDDFLLNLMPAIISASQGRSR